MKGSGASLLGLALRVSSELTLGLAVAVESFDDGRGFGLLNTLVIPCL